VPLTSDERRIAMTTPLATTTPPVIQAATNLMAVLWAAELRDLPMPFATRAYERTGPGQIVLQFRTRAEVVRWLVAIEGVIVEKRLTTEATGELLDIPVTVVSAVQS
jgi:hypothetical protein